MRSATSPSAWLTALSRKALAAVGATNRLTIANTRGAQLTLTVIAEYRLALTAASALRLGGRGVMDNGAWRKPRLAPCG